jgi:hypothetical protein
LRLIRSLEDDADQGDAPPSHYDALSVLRIARASAAGVASPTIASTAPERRKSASWHLSRSLKVGAHSAVVVSKRVSGVWVASAVSEEIGFAVELYAKLCNVGIKGSQGVVANSAADWLMVLAGYFSRHVP